VKRIHQIGTREQVESPPTAVFTGWHAFQNGLSGLRGRSASSPPALRRATNIINGRWLGLTDMEHPTIWPTKCRLAFRESKIS